MSPSKPPFPHLQLGLTIALVACGDEPSPSADPRDQAITRLLDDVLADELSDGIAPFDAYVALEPSAAGDRLVEAVPAPEPGESDDPPLVDLVLDRPAFVAWLDDEPSAGFEHDTRYVVLYDDGTTEVHDARWWPSLSGVELRPVVADPSRAELLVFSGIDPVRLAGVSPRQATLPNPGPSQELATLDPAAFEGTVGGVLVDGTDTTDDWSDRNVEKVRELLQCLGLPTTGNEATIDTLDAAERLSGGDLVDAIRRGCEGLGEGDKFFFYYSGHGARDRLTPHGGSISHARLARALRDECDAEYVNVVLQACHSGRAQNDFEDVFGDRTDRRVRVITSTSQDDGNAKSHHDPDACSFMTEALVEFLTARKEALGDEEPGIDELEEWMEGDGTLPEQTEMRYCDHQRRKAERQYEEAFAREIERVSRHPRKSVSQREQCVMELEQTRDDPRQREEAIATLTERLKARSEAEVPSYGDYGSAPLPGACQMPLTITCTNECPGGPCCADAEVPEGEVSCELLCEPGIGPWCP